MSLSSKKKPASSRWERARPWLQGLCALLGVLVCAALFQQRWNNRKPQTVATAPIFSPTFPIAADTQAELALLRQTGRLTTENEALIARTIDSVSTSSSIPKSLLWCLLFQESRLDHTLGMTEQTGIHGLGQFSAFSFHEINFQMDRFHSSNSAILINALGKDVRPISPDKKRPQAPSSYFYIPTAVAASASYLNNRFFHLKSLLKRRDIEYNDDVLWLYAAMAYNKGTRSVLSIWNQVQQARGSAGLSMAVSDLRAFRGVSQDRALLQRSLKRIWPKVQAEAYAKELSIHAENIASCAVQAQLAKPKLETVQ